MGVDNVDGTIALINMTYLASTGDEQAQAGLLGVADQFGKFIRDPAGSIDGYTQKQLEIADQYRAAGDEESAKQVEFQLAFEYIGAFTGITSVTASIPKNVIRSFSRNGTDIDVNISSSGNTSDIDTPVEGVSNTDVAGTEGKPNTGTNGSYDSEGDFGSLNQPTIDSNIPGGGLDVHEISGGHLLEEHVGQSREYLEERIRAEGLPAASTFNSLSAAERSVNQVLNLKSSEISEFLRGAERKTAFERVPVSGSGGKVLTESGEFLSTSRVTVVIVRDSKMPNGYRVQTGFPEL